MKPSAFEYFAPAGLEEAVGLLEQHGEEARPLAGGQSLLPLMKLGLAREGGLHPLQEAFWENHAVQCGYCTPGMLMAAYDLLQCCPHPSEQEIRAGISGNLCRCTGYVNIVKAIQAAAAKESLT